jgi:hypothetical protein
MRTVSAGELFELFKIVIVPFSLNLPYKKLPRWTFNKQQLKLETFNERKKSPPEIGKRSKENSRRNLHNRRLEPILGLPPPPPIPVRLSPPIVIIKPPDRLIGELCEFNWTKGDFIATRSSATTGRSVRHLSLAASR